MFYIINNDVLQCFKVILFSIGFFTANGKLWQSNRRSSLRYLKDFGMGKSSMQDTIQDEAAALIKVNHH